MNMAEPWHKGEWWTAFDYCTCKCEKDDSRILISLDEHEREAARLNLLLDPTDDPGGAIKWQRDEAEESLPKGNTKVAWYYGWSDEYDNPALTIYRDDQFSIRLPHAAGLELLKVLQKSVALDRARQAV
jgi:hypothetical protein